MWIWSSSSADLLHVPRANLIYTRSSRFPCICPNYLELSSVLRPFIQHIQFQEAFSAFWRQTPSRLIHLHVGLRKVTTITVNMQLLALHVTGILLRTYALIILENS